MTVNVSTPSAVSARLELPARACGLVVIADEFAVIRGKARTAYLARYLARAGLGTLQLALLEGAEARDPRQIYDIDALTDRLDAAARGLTRRSEAKGLPLSLLGAGTGSAAALRLAARAEERITSVVCRGGRPDLAGDALAAVRIPVLLLAGTRDRGEIDLLRSTRLRLGGENDLILLPRSDRALDEEHELALAARIAAHWVLSHTPGFHRD